ncbi:MAG: TRAP transporter small permease [Deltaproteobacteria bacterium]|nr:TRAP transporter small permease [Deltaproteobacteria bacterium]
MNGKEVIKRFFDNFESYICQLLLAFFVTLLFVQIILREIFSYTLSWGEELARFSFVWFVFFGAVVAARLAAHNRVTFQFKMFSKKTQNYIEGFADLIWLIFNGVMIWKSIFLIKSMMQFTYISPTLGWSMAYVYLIFPIAFTLMSIRIIQVNYLKLIKGVDIRDPDKVDLEEEFEKITGSKDA